LLSPKIRDKIKEKTKWKMTSIHDCFQTIISSTIINHIDKPSNKHDNDSDNDNICLQIFQIACESLNRLLLSLEGNIVQHQNVILGQLYDTSSFEMFDIINSVYLPASVDNDSSSTTYTTSSFSVAVSDILGSTDSSNTYPKSITQTIEFSTYLDASYLIIFRTILMTSLLFSLTQFITVFSQDMLPSEIDHLLRVDHFEKYKKLKSLMKHGLFSQTGMLTLTSASTSSQYVTNFIRLLTQSLCRVRDIHSHCIKLIKFLIHTSTEIKTDLIKLRNSCENFLKRYACCWQVSLNYIGLYYIQKIEEYNKSNSLKLTSSQLSMDEEIPTIFGRGNLTFSQSIHNHQDNMLLTFDESQSHTVAAVDNPFTHYINGSLNSIFVELIQVT
jgi:hypothetical protein